jgi:hypothetical protein
VAATHRASVERGVLGTQDDGWVVMVLLLQELS